MPHEPLENREYDEDEVQALPRSRQPRPFDPISLSAGGTGRGKGHLRKSLAGDRWCPYCHTPLFTAQQSCDVCYPVRSNLVRAGGLEEPSEEVDPRLLEQSMVELLNAVDEMSRVVGISNAHRNRGNGLGKEQVEDMFTVCKDVMLAAERIRREQQQS